MNGANNAYLILSLSLFIRMTPKVYNAQSRFLDALAMISWPKNHYKKVEWAKKYNDINYKNKKVFKFAGDILFKNVSFYYPNSKLVLNNLNLIIKKNEYEQDWKFWHW